MVVLNTMDSLSTNAFAGPSSVIIPIILNFYRGPQSFLQQSLGQCTQGVQVLLVVLRSTRSTEYVIVQPTGNCLIGKMPHFPLNNSLT
jgi:hypothetical protein